MPQEVFAPRPDAIDGELYIETRATAAASSALWALLELSRKEPRPWLPMTVLCGAPGSGRTTLARRFSAATQRNVACDLVLDRVGDMDAHLAAGAEEARAQAFSWAEHMVRTRGGNCPGVCRPAAWVPADVIDEALSEAGQAWPAISLDMPTRPDRESNWLASRTWHSPGNLAHDPTRRTSIVIMDGADRLLAVPQSKRLGVLDRMQGWERVVGHPLTFVLIGGPALAAAVSEVRSTQVIRIDPMAPGAEFAAVAGMICGTRDPHEIAALHRASGGLIGRLCHVARMRGLTPPYNVRPEEIVRLPALPAPK